MFLDLNIQTAWFNGMFISSRLLEQIAAKNDPNKNLVGSANLLCGR